MTFGIKIYGFDQGIPSIVKSESGQRKGVGKKCMGMRRHIDKDMEWPRKHFIDRLREEKPHKTKSTKRNNKTMGHVIELMHILWDSTRIWWTISPVRTCRKPSTVTTVKIPNDKRSGAIPKRNAFRYEMRDFLPNATPP
jgi:hypothetical protein